MKKKTVAVYAKVSTDKQKVDMQLDSGLRIAGMTVIHLVVQLFNTSR
jgi:predicted site-specific integrase-resolvase